MKTAITIILTLLMILAFGQSKEMYQKIGDSLMMQNKHDELINFFEMELKKYPKNEDILRWLGYIHIAKNNLDLGEKYYSDALSVNPKCARCYLNIGRLYSLRGDNKKALEYFDKAVNTDPNDALLYTTRAMLKEMLGDEYGALRDHNKAIETDPNNADYYVQRGLYNSNAGYSSLAISDLTKAIELAPENYYSYFQRANVYYGQKRLDEALKDINKAIDLDSNQFSLYTGRGAIFAVMEEYERAIKDYTKAISLNPTDFLPCLNRASANYKLEDLDASCSDYLILRSLIENGHITDQSTINEIKATFQDICDSTRPSYYYQRGVALYNLKEFQKAIDVYTEGLNKFPGDGMTLSFKGNAYLTLGEYQKALENYSLSLRFKENILTEIKLNPRFTGASAEMITSFYNCSIASIYFNIAKCKVNLGLFDEALNDINEAIELTPNIKEIDKAAYYNMRGYVYLNVGKHERAITDFNKSIQINESFSLAYVNRAIGKVSMIEKAKISSYSIKSISSNQPMSINWTLPSKSSLKKSESTILSALSDCNTAIEIDENLGFAYYIRGQIKQMLGYGDYCLDLLNAKQSGLIVEYELLKNCGK